MNASPIIDRLERFPEALRAVVACASPEDARWKPPSGAWSILEVVCHLGDEEVLDFRTRVQSTLRDAGAAWPGIDPEGWARERKYNEQGLAAALARFTDERAASVRWLRTLNNPDWTVAHQHPRFGPIKAGDLLASWAAHDALHLRQIAKRLHELAARDGAGCSIEYAGEWRA